MGEHTVDIIPDRALVERALHSLRPTNNKPLWVLVMKTFGLGSTFAHQLCRRHGLNPEAISKQTTAEATTDGERGEA